MKGKFVGLIMLFLVSILAVSIVNALPITVKELKVNGDIVQEGDTIRTDVMTGEDFEVIVRLNSSAALENVEIEASIKGYEYNDYIRISDTTHVFGMEPGVIYKRTLTLPLPANVDEGDYKLRIYIADQNGEETSLNYNLKLDIERHNVIIKDVVFSDDRIVGGRALLSTVRIKNIGEKNEEGIKVTVEIPALGLKASDYIDELEADESTTSEELYIRIPTCAEAGIYDVIVTIEYDEGYEEVTMEKSIEILENEICAPIGEEEDKTIVTIPEAQNIVKGTSGVVYPITITNLAGSAKTYTITVSGVDAFGSYRIDPSNVIVVQGKDAKTAYIYITANDDAQAGEKAFIVNIATDADSKDIALTASVVEPSVSAWGKVRKVLEIGLIVLVVILIIIGLAIGFSKLRRREEEEEEPEEEPGSQTYY